MSNNTTIYEIGLNELHRVSADESTHKQVDNEFREARGREGARLHVTLKALSEAERRNNENTRATLESIAQLTSELQTRAAALTNLIQTFENTADKRFSGVHDDLRSRADSLVAQVNAFANAELEHFGTIRNQMTVFQQAVSLQVQETRSALASQSDAHFQAVSSQARENTERLAVDLRHVRDEVVGLVDSRMTQADASFAALRGDVEVVKYLVMDLIKDRIGRSDPKQKPF